MHYVQGKKLSFDPSNFYYFTTELYLVGRKSKENGFHRYSFQLNKVFYSTCIPSGGKDNRESSFISGHEVTYKYIGIRGCGNSRKFARRSKFCLNSFYRCVKKKVLNLILTEVKQNIEKSKLERRGKFFNAL